MENVLATEKHFEEAIRPLPKAEQEKKLAEMANSVQAGTPPRENSREQRTIDVVVGAEAWNRRRWCCLGPVATNKRVCFKLGERTA